MTASGYVNASRQKINGDFENVVEQTGVFAGQQGFEIRVGEHTQFNGAVLAGSEDAGKNHLSTGTLGWSDLVNRAEYKVESTSKNLENLGHPPFGASQKGGCRPLRPGDSQSLTWSWWWKSVFYKGFWQSIEINRCNKFG
jgi:filamentous hemagglutinin